MKKNYLALVFSLIATISMAQTTEMVNDYYTTDNGWGLNPYMMISNSQGLVFQGAVNRTGNPMFGYRYFFEGFVSDGVETITNLNINQTDATSASTPKNFFVYNDTVYFQAYDGSINMW